MSSHESYAGWGVEQTQSPIKTSAGARLREAFNNVDPAVKARAFELGAGVGTEALKGAGIVKERRDGSLKVNKLGVLRAALSPQVAVANGLRRGAMEARSTAVGVAKEQAVGMARTAVTNAMSGEAFTPAVTTANEWGSPASADTNDWGVPSSGTADWNKSPSTWVETPTHQWGAPDAMAPSVNVPEWGAPVPSQPSEWNPAPQPVWNTQPPVGQVAPPSNWGAPIR